MAQPTTIATLALAGAALVGLALLAWRWLRLRRERAAYRAASERFRAAVLAELGAIYPRPDPWPEDINDYLRARYRKLHAAVLEFQPHVPRRRQARFAQAWLEYHGGTPGKADPQNYQQYLSLAGQTEARSRFRANVARLLAFAEGD
jgi:hypothetical protein